MKLLNSGYESESVGGSLYYNSGSGTCYYSSNNAQTACDFASSGLKENLKALIGDVIWNTGSQGTNSSRLTSRFYTYERSNDTVERTTACPGKVGLMYPSDYGYATSGGSTTNRTSCLNQKLYIWSSYRDCYNND